MQVFFQARSTLQQPGSQGVAATEGCCCGTLANNWMDFNLFTCHKVAFRSGLKQKWGSGRSSQDDRKSGRFQPAFEPSHQQVWRQGWSRVTCAPPPRRFYQTMEKLPTIPGIRSRLMSPGDDCLLNLKTGAGETFCF